MKFIFFKNIKSELNRILYDNDQKDYDKINFEKLSINLLNQLKDLIDNPNVKDEILTSILILMLMILTSFLLSSQNNDDIINYYQDVN